MCLCAAAVSQTESENVGAWYKNGRKSLLASITVDHATNTQTHGFVMHVQRGTRRGRQTQNTLREVAVRAEPHLSKGTAKGRGSRQLSQKFTETGNIGATL